MSRLTSRSRFAAWRAAELQPGALATSAVTGLVAYGVEILGIVAFAALVFSGRLAGHLPAALDFILLGDAVLCAVVALLSSYPGTFAIAQDTSAVLLAAMATSSIASLPAAARPAQQFATVLVLLAGTAVLTGLCLLVLGLFRLAGLVRFLPFPVLGGFLAGTGWLLAAGGVGIMAHTTRTVDLLRPVMVAHWLPGAFLGVVLLAALGRTRHWLTLPALCAASFLAFYAVALATGTSPDHLRAAGWLLGPMPSGSTWEFPLSPGIVRQVDWPVLLQQMPSMAPLLVVTTIGLLLNAGGMELIAARDIDLNRELVAAGVANLAVGAVGGLVGYQSISLSSLNHTMSGGRRLAALVTALLLGVTAFVGVAALSIVPTLLLGGLLIYLGLDLLHEWVYRAWFTLSHVDFLIVVSIMGVIAARGFLAGIAIGLALAVVVFVVNAGRTSVVKHALSGMESRSRVTRGPGQQAILQAHGSELYLLKLQGMIFFGTAHSLYEHIRARVRNTDLPVLRFVVLDFAQVTGMDATGLLSFTRLRQLAQEWRLTLVLTGLPAGVRAQFARGGFCEEPGLLRIFADLDHGMEWCEEEIIAGHASGERDEHPPGHPKPVAEQLEPVMPVGNRAPPLERTLQAPVAHGEEVDSLRAQLTAILPVGDSVDRLLAWLQRRELNEGEYLIRQGDEPDQLYFIETGQVTARLEVAGQAPLRLETMRGGRVVGELGFYLGGKRTASVVTDEPSIVYCLSISDLARIEEADPAAASLLHRVIVHLMGERVVHLIRAVEALQR